MDEGAPGRAVCVAYVDPAGAAPDKTVSRQLDADGDRTSGMTQCFEDGQGTTAKRIQVVMEREGTLDLGFHRQTAAAQPNRRVPLRGGQWPLTAEPAVLTTTAARSS